MPAPRTIITIMRPITRYYEYLRHRWQAALPLTLAVFLFLWPVGPIYADLNDSELWEQAVDHVQHRNYDAAVPLLEIMLDRDPGDLRVVRTLATVHEMLGRPDEAQQLLEEALEGPGLSGSDRGRVAFDLAVLLARRDRQAEAVEMYAVSLRHDEGLTAVYLNRANLRVQLSEYDDAIRDYERFLALRPGTGQRGAIEQMIALLRRTVEEEEMRRAEEERREREAEEAQRIAEEARRVEEERRRVEAEERRRKMMESVMESLGTARDDARGARADREGIIDFEDDLELLD